jgi:hypothetical protein
MTTRNLTPAISREYNVEDDAVETVAGIYEKRNRNPGLGNSGRIVEIVDKECEACHYDRMIRDVRINPVDHDHVSYYCQHPNCPYHHKGRLGLGRI